MAVAAAALVGAAGFSGGGGSYRGGDVLFRFADERIDESSGVAVSADAQTVFTHNDSGDTARFFAVDLRGCTLATYRLTGPGGDDAVDWEDAARAGDTLYFADTGDNGRRRAQVDVYAVPVPEVPPTGPGACLPSADRTTPSTRYRLRYPDGPHDVETLLVDPADCRLYLVTKEPDGRSAVYATSSPARPAGSAPSSGSAPSAGSGDQPPLSPSADNELTKVAEVDFPVSPTLPGIGQLGKPDDVLLQLAGRFLATGGDIAPDRSRVVIRTYSDAWEWNLGPTADLAETLSRAPDRQLPLPSVRQGEAITYAGRDLVTTCEDPHCPAHIFRRR